MKKKMKNALIVRSYFEQKWISPVIEIGYMTKNKSTSVITVKKSFKKSNLGRHIDGLEESNLPDNSNSGSNNKVMNIVYNCSQCNEEYLDKRSLKRHEKNKYHIIL